MNYKTEELLIITLTVVIFVAISLTINPNIIGYTIYQPNLSYNDNIINDNGIQLKQQSYITNWTTEQTLYYTLIFAEESGNNGLEKLINLDNNILILEKNNLLKIKFDNNLQNKDKINLYLKGNNEITINICNFNINNTCDNQVIYATINYLGIEGNYQATLNVEETNQLIIDADKKLEIDYINSSHLEITEHSNTTYYYNPSSIETEIIQPNNLQKWDLFTADYELNNQTISFYYKIIEEYIKFTPPHNFSEINSSSLQFKLFLSSNNISTPVIYNLTINYLEIPCQENWICTNWTDCINETITRVCTDLSECSTTENKPTEIEECTIEEDEEPQEEQKSSSQPPSLTQYKSSSPSTFLQEKESPKTETKTVSQQIELKAEEPEPEIQITLEETPNNVKIIGNAVALSYLLFICLLLYKRKHKL